MSEDGRGGESELNWGETCRHVRGRACVGSVF